MREPDQLPEKPRVRFMEVAQKEMIDFERKERDFRKQDKQERAAELRMPALIRTEFHG